jgi:hypothetical protein
MSGDEFDFNAYRQQMNELEKWVFVVPVSGVVLTKDVNREFRIKRVLLVAQDKLPRIRKRLGMPQRLSDLKKRYATRFFDSARTFAVLRHSGRPGELKNKCLRMVKDELSILAVSQLGYSKRRLGSCPTIEGESTVAKINLLLLSTEDTRKIMEGRLVGKVDELFLDSLWKQYHRKAFFLKLLKVLNGDIRASRAWRDDLARAAILVGQSQCSTDVAQSFLWNMIALELLLTEQGDKYTDVLPKRIEAFLGWVGFWTTNDYTDKIAEVYRKRCAFVHSSRRENITIQDLLFTDDLLYNLLLNLVHHIDQFSSKQAVIDFSEKVEAEHRLGVKPRVRPKTLTFVSWTYSQRDYEEI